MRRLLLPLILAGAFVMADTAQAQNPCNPCSKKSKKEMQNPCNPCAKKMKNPCNPCGMKASGDVTVTGEIIDVKCYINGMQGGRGPEHEDCAIACIKGGLPVGIIDKSGKTYMLVPARGMKGANEALLPFVAKNVTVKGTVKGKGGTDLLYYTSVEAAK